MKYVVILGDGMADEPIEELGGRTPLMAARTPGMEELAKTGEVGLAKTIPEGMSPGSDTANLSVLGYDPKKYYTGRSPLEALSIGVDMEEADIALRMNFVTLSGEEELSFEERRILDHSAGEISTEEAGELLEAVKEAFEQENYRFFRGTSYRHLLIWKGGRVAELTAPHDILEKRVGEYLPKEPCLKEMMEKSWEILKDHPVNLRRAKEGKNPANSIWFWGAGTRPFLDSFQEKTGKKGAMISAVDLLKGIAVGAKMKNISVKGANGGLHTNYEGKAEAAVKALLEDGMDFVYVHLEAPDEMGHQGKLEDKIKAIEYLDSRILVPIKQALDGAQKPYRMLVMPDHPTPIRLRTHTANPVPYLLYDSQKTLGKGCPYHEEGAAQSGIFIENGYTLMDRLLEENA